ncbi:MAG: serine/threonine-protein kinase [Huintestinicola sp.]
MYKKISVIHKSKQSTVWLCETKEGGRAVCKELRSDPKVYERLKAAECPYIPKIYEINVTSVNEDGQKSLEIFEEYIDGNTLQELSLSRREAVRAAIGLCRAVDGLHSLGIIHRDIKPSNIMLDGSGCLKIVDLSSARLFKEEMDKDTVCLGTEGFAAPEQYGFSQTDFRTDIFAVGQTLRLIFENREPFPVGYIISRCTSFDPDKRFKSCKPIVLLLKTSQPAAICASAAAVIAVTALCIIPRIDSPNVPVSAPPVSIETEQTEISADLINVSTIDPEYDYGVEELRLSLEAEYAPSPEGCEGSDISEGFLFMYGNI